MRSTVSVRHRKGKETMEEKNTVWIEFSSEEEVLREIAPNQLREGLQQMQPGETLIVRFDNEES